MSSLLEKYIDGDNRGSLRRVYNSTSQEENPSVRKTRDTYEDTIDSACSRQSHRKRNDVRYHQIPSLRYASATSFLCFLASSALPVVRMSLLFPVSWGALRCR